MKNHGIALSVLSFFVTISAWAQTGTTLKGKIIDEHQKGLPMAVIKLVSNSDTLKKINTIADSSGNFNINVTVQGLYTLQCTFATYKPAIKRMAIKEGYTGTLNLGIIRLLPNVNVLNEVKITAPKNFMTVENDKKVFDPSQLGGVASGSASDVMQQIPLVNVDKDGNITLRGKAANVLIDGKPSPYSDVATALQMISATAIEKVEVMTSPSAKYDAEGQGGIVNIVLKKNKDAGYHGVVNLDLSTQTDHHAGTDFNIRKKNFNIFGNINLHTRKVNGAGENNQHFFEQGNYINQESSSTVGNKDIDTRLGFEYYINDRSNITLTQGFANRNRQNITTFNTDSGSTASALFPVSSGNNSASERNHTYNTDLNFTHRFAKAGEELTADAMFSTNKVVTTTALNTTGTLAGTRSQQNTGNNQNNLFVVSADYIDPIGKNNKLETGIKSSLTDSHNTVDALLYDEGLQTFINNTSLSSIFSYKEQIYAAYAMYSDKFSGLEYKAGIRSELALLNGDDILQRNSFCKSYFNLFPGMYLTKELPGNQTLGISYATRTSRPTFSQLNPYVDLTNPINHLSGNPNLAPAYAQNIELNYSKLFEKNNDFFNAGIYYTHTSNSIQMVTDNQNAVFTTTTPQNIGADNAIGGNIIYRLNISKLLNLTGTFDINYDKFSDDEEAVLDKRFWNKSLRLQGNWALPHQFTVLAHGEVTGPQNIPQGYINRNKGVDIELKKTFLKNKMTTSAIVSDIFNQRKEISNINTIAFSQYSYYKENSRMLHLHLSYAF